MESLLINAVSNPIGAIVEANYIGVLVWAVIFGLAMRSASDNTKNVIENISDVLFYSYQMGYQLCAFRYNGAGVYYCVNGRYTGNGILRQDNTCTR